MIFSIATLFLALMVAGTSATDYCRKGLCQGNAVHIGCNNNNKFASSCLAPELVDFSTTLQNLVITTHNVYRNKVASGSTKLAQANRMPMLKWNPELAKLAEYNVRQCKMAHDQCRNTDQFAWAGQNLGYHATTAALSPAVIQSYIIATMDSWFNEIKDANQNWIDKYPGSTGGKVIGHFTAMVQDRATAIGCAAATYKMKSGSYLLNTVLLACDYSYTNVLGTPVYAKGSVGSKCTTGLDGTYKGLCSAAENVKSAP